MAESRFIKSPIEQTVGGRLGGYIYMFIGIAMCLGFATFLVGDNVLGGVKMILAMGISSLVLLWFLTTERIDLGVLGLFFYMGTFEGVLKFNTSGSVYFLVIAVRNILLAALILNLVIKGYLRRLADTGYRFAWPPMTPLIVFYVIWCLISIFHPDGINFANSVAGVRPHIEFVPLYFLGFIICQKDPQWFIKLLILFVIMGVLNAVAAIHQYRLGPENLAAYWGPGYQTLVSNQTELGQEIKIKSSRDLITGGKRLYLDENYNAQLRPPGLGSESTFPAIVGQIGVFAVMVLLFYYLRTKKNWLVTFLILSLVIIFAGIVVAASRSYLLLTFTGLVVGALFYVREVFQGQKLKIFILLIVISTLAMSNYLVHSYVSESAYSRYENISTPEKLIERLKTEKFPNWVFTRRYFLESPLGRGLGKVGPGSGFFATGIEQLESLGNGETEINYILSELGVVGLVLFYTFILGTFFRSSVLMRTSPPDSYQRLVSVIVFLYLLIFLANCMWGTGMIFPTKACIWLFSGCFWALHNRLDAFEVPESKPLIVY